MAKKEAPPEHSVAMRVVDCVMAMLCIATSFSFGESLVPVIEFSFFQWSIILLCLWLAVIGSAVSYHYRETQPQVLNLLIKVATVLILLNLIRELIQDNLMAAQFQYTRPLVHAFAAASVIGAFELRTTNDILGHGIFGLVLLALAATSGKSIIFAAVVCAYLCLGAALLILSCRSQSRNTTPGTQPLIHQVPGKQSMTATIAAISILPVLSIALFSFFPRLDAQADSISAHCRAVAAGILYNARNGVPIFAGTQPANDDGRIQRLMRKEGAKIQAERKDTHNSNSSKSDTPANKAATKRKNPPLQPTKPPAPQLQDQNPYSADKQRPPDEQEEGTAEAVSPVPQSQPASDLPIRPMPEPTNTANTPVEQQSQPPQPTATGDNDGGNPSDQASPEKSNSTADQHQQTNGEGMPPPNTANTNDSKPPVQDSSTTIKEPTQPPPQKPKRETATTIESDVDSVHMSDATAKSEDVVFTFACNRDAYTRLTAMSNFDGHRWRKETLERAMSLPPNAHSIIDFSVCNYTHPPDALPYMEVAETISIKKDGGNYLPIAGVPERMEFHNPVYADEAGSVRTTFTLPPGTTYSLLAQLPVFSLAELRAAAEGSDPPNIGYLVALPENQSPELVRLADELTAGGGNRFVQAEKICNHLRAHYDYKFNTKSKPDTANLADDFLFNTKQGDCKAYASGFVCLCRAAGIPARFVVGFAPGDPDPISGATLVREKHGHAWGEIFMNPYGWIPFDPTPDGMLPARAEQSYYNAERIQKELASYSKKVNEHANGTIPAILAYLGHAINVILLGIAFLTLLLISKEIGPFFLNLKQAWHKHPATRIKEKVYRRLKKCGVNSVPSDTGGDVLRKLRATVSAEDPFAAHKTSDIEGTLSQFVETYNAIYYGNEDKMNDLRSLSRQLESLIR